MTKVEIGNATLYHGDCLEILPTLPKVDAVITDPPYEVGAKGYGLAGDRQYLKDITSARIDKGFDIDVLLGYNHIVCFCAKAQIAKMIHFAESNGASWQLLTWHKTNPTPLTNNNYLPDTEYIFHIWKGRKLGGDYDSKRKWFVTDVEKNSWGHPTVKPLSIMEPIVKNATEPGQLVLDPFMGTGTTGVACMNLGRKFIGIEIEKKYFDVAVERIDQAQRQGRMFA